MWPDGGLAVALILYQKYLSLLLDGPQGASPPDEAQGFSSAWCMYGGLLVSQQRS